MLPLFRRTDAGRAEVAARTAGLSRSARNLLLVIDDSQPPEQWIASVRGSTEADLLHLRELGLITSLDKPAAPREMTDEILLRELLRKIHDLPYQPLYEALNGFGKTVLGVLGAYRFALDVERCNGTAELQSFATKFVMRIRDQFGLDEVRRFAKHLDSATAASARPT